LILNELPSSRIGDAIGASRNSVNSFTQYHSRSRKAIEKIGDVVSELAGKGLTAFCQLL